MKKGQVCLGLLLVSALVLGACGGDDGVTPGSGGAGDDTVAAEPPTKEAVIAVLRDLLGALEARDYDRAITHFIEYPGMTAEAMKTAATGFIDKREISKAGIDILAERGEFGPLKDVLPGGGAEFAKGAGVPLDRAYGLVSGDAVVAVVQKGGALLVFRLDDVGKLR